VLRLPFLVSLGILLAACQFLPDKPLRANSVIKSVNDEREYRYIELPNQLKVLLISDPSATKAAASMDLHVGSRHDPPQYQGLAHFLEHMLFLGTKKYPEINGYQTFIAEHGGSTNAFTSFEHTNYFFDVNRDALGEALDRFADFFMQPNFSPDYIAREINAVEAEFRSRYPRDGIRIVDATREVVSKSHPYRKFSVGSLETLNVPDLREALLDFYQRYYSASRMALAVAASGSLDSLEALVREKFSGIASSGEKTAELTTPLFNAAENETLALPKILSVQTKKPLRQLVLSFPLPNLNPHFQSKPMQYIANVLGDEGPGSLLSVLKRENLVESLSASIGLQYKGGALFQLQLSLTEKGIGNLSNIIGAVFVQLESIRYEQQVEPQKMQQRFHEQRELAATAFRFYQPPSLRTTVLHLSSAMHYYPWQSVVSGGYDFSIFDAELILKFCDYLRADNMLVTLAAQQLPAAFAATQKSKHYHTPYGEYPIPEQWRRAWEHRSFSAVTEQLELPAVNPFIPTNFALHEAGDYFFADENPLLLEAVPGMRVWWRLDNEFEVPKAAFYVSFLTSLPRQSARNQMLTALYIKAVNDQLTEQVYPAYLAGMNYSFYRHQRGLSLKLTGYNQSLLPLFDQLVAAVSAVNVSERRLQELTEVLKRHWRSAKQAPAHQQLGRELAQQLLPGTASYEELLAEIETVSLLEVKEFSSSLLQSSYIEILGHGNLSLAELNELKQAAANFSNCGCDYQADNYRVVERKLLAKERESRAHTHSDVAVLWYFQAPDTALQSEVATLLLARIANTEFYTELRTEQQLGYVVGAHYHKLAQLPALSLVVQSPHASTGKVVESMTMFIQEFVGQSRSAAEFERHKAALLADLLRPDRSLLGRSNRFWQALALGDASIEPLFMRRQQLADALQQLTFAQWRTHLGQMLNPERASMLITTADQL